MISLFSDSFGEKLPRKVCPMSLLKKAFLLSTALTVVCPAFASVIQIADTRTIAAGEDSVYQDVSGGIVVRAPANLTFTGGVIWDYTSYSTAVPADLSPTNIYNPATDADNYWIGRTAISGNVVIENGNFYDSASGGIKFYKGHDVTSKSITTYDEEMNPTTRVYAVDSSGNFSINGGNFYFAHRTDNQFLLKANADSNSLFYLNNGTFDFQTGTKASFGTVPANQMEVHGGTYIFHNGGEMVWTAADILFQDDARYTASNFSGRGTLTTSSSFGSPQEYGGSATTHINTPILWREGTLNLFQGVMELKQDVTIGSFTFGAAYATLNVNDKRALTVENDFVMQATSFLIGDGTLRLVDGADADFNQLKFGEIISLGNGTGTLTFRGDSEVKKITLDNATLNVSANLSVDDLTLRNGTTANLDGNLAVGTLTVGDSEIAYVREEASLQFNKTATLYNTTRISVSNTVDNGNIVINPASQSQQSGGAGADETSAVSLNFEDEENSDRRFENNKISVKGQPNGIVNFNQSRGVALNNMTLLYATANFNKGSSSFSTVVLGNIDNSKPGLITVAEGASLTIDTLTSHYGSESRINGTLDIGAGSVIDGDRSSYSVVSGTGTLVASGNVTFNGLFKDFNTLKVNADAADVTMTVAGLTGKDKIKKIQFSGMHEGRLNINAGMLTINSLIFDEGSDGGILIGDNGTLALDAGTGEATDIISGTGTISGPTGTLRLVGQTGINFGGGGGGIGTLGKLEIGTGTAKISSNLTIGSVSFYTNEGGTLEIENGTTLTLASLTTGAGNTVTGAGTLKLTSTTPSTLGGTTSLSTLTLQETGMSVNFTGNASVATLNTAAGNTLDIAAGKKLSLTDAGTRVTVQGNGTMAVLHSANLSANDINGLEIAGTATVTGTVKNMTVSGTATVDTELNVSQSLTMQEGGVVNGPLVRLTGGTATFAANSLGAASFVAAAGTTTAFTGNNAPTLLTFTDTTSMVSIGTGATLTVNQDLLSGTISGAGTLKLNKSGMNVASPMANLNTLTVQESAVLNGTLRNIGTLNALSPVRLNADAVVSTLNANAEMTVQQTLTVSNSAAFADNTLTGIGTLVLNGSATFGENDFSEGSVQTAGFTINDGATFQLGTLVLTGDGAVSGGTLALVGQNTGIARKFSVDKLNVAGKVSFNAGESVVKALSGNGTVVIGSGATVQTAGASTVAVESRGNLVLRDNLTIGSGTFENGSKIDMRALTLTADTLTFNRGSEVSFTTKGMTPLLSVGSTLTADGVKLVPKIAYSQDSTTFKLSDKMWTAGSSFSFENNLYQLTETNCDGGLCFVVNKKDGAAAGIAGGGGGTQNNSQTAGALLDGAVFGEQDNMSNVASRISDLAQESNPKAYHDALTALAPDVSGAVTNASSQTQTKLTQVVFNRMDTLRDSFGKYATFRARGRSGGSGYDSRLMRASDYYRRAGYYDDNDRPVRPNPSRYRSPTQEQRDYYYRTRSGEASENRSQTTSWQRRYDKKRIPVYAGAWAQALYNKTSYKSASKPDGFEGDTTGYAAGFDAVFLDVFAAGIGYSHSSSDIKALGRDTTYDADTFFLYGMYKPSQWYVSGILNYGTGSFDEVKNVGGINVNDSYDSSMIGGQVMIGYAFEKWRPAVGVRYASISQDGRTDSVGQVIGSSSNKVVTAVAETRWSKPLQSFGEPMLELYGALSYDISNSADEATVQLSNGATYTVKGSDPDPFGAQVGAELNWTFKEKMELSTRYELEVKPDYFSHTVMATFRYMF